MCSLRARVAGEGERGGGVGVRQYAYQVFVGVLAVEGDVGGARGLVLVVVLVLGNMRCMLLLVRAVRRSTASAVGVPGSHWSRAAEANLGRRSWRVVMYCQPWASVARKSSVSAGQQHDFGLVADGGQQCGQRLGLVRRSR